MSELHFFCKTYRRDFYRVKRLVESFQQHKKDPIHFYISVPVDDVDLFQSLRQKSVSIISDRDIYQLNSKINVDGYNDLPGYIQQQIIKAEFWRYNPCPVYLCIDSDSIFIRDFYIKDFLAPDGHPYTTINQAQTLMEEAVMRGKDKILDQYLQDVVIIQNLLSREGIAYSFGPTPVAWDARVWQSLEDNYLIPNQLTILDAIVKAPSELRWYGEALLKFNAIPMHPTEPFFKVFHYSWQFNHQFSKKMDSLKKIYIGMVYQSNWDKANDWPRPPKSLFHRILNKA
jgi:Family of unknown function (DUF6492)